MWEISPNRKFPGRGRFVLAPCLLARRCLPCGRGDNPLCHAQLSEQRPDHIHILEELIVEGQASGPRVTDAALAALALEYGATLASTDRDFSRFPDLRWINPLELR